MLAMGSDTIWRAEDVSPPRIPRNLGGFTASQPPLANRYHYLAM